MVIFYFTWRYAHSQASNRNTAKREEEEELYIWRSEECNRPPLQAAARHYSLLLGRRWACLDLWYPESLRFRSGAVASTDFFTSQFWVGWCIADFGGTVRAGCRGWSGAFLILHLRRPFLVMGPSRFCGWSSCSRSSASLWCHLAKNRTLLP